MTEDFTMIAGTNRTLVFTVRDIGNVTVDISTADVVWVTTTTTNGEPVLTKTSDTPAELSITDGANGVFEVYLVPADTDTDAGATFFHEARVILATVEEVVHQGSFTVTYSTSYGHMPV